MAVSSGFFSNPSDFCDGAIGEPQLIFDSPSGYSSIWKANFNGQFRVVKALKEKYRGDSMYEAMLRKEFEIGHSLSHPNICDYIAFTALPSTGNCIVMEWVDGYTLQDVLQDIKGDSVLRQKIITEICDALKYIHSKQIVHRDLKPENILITRNGWNVKLLDFGLADSDSHIYLKESAGTPAYAAPEIKNGASADSRSDIYSLGMIISQMGGSRRLKHVARKCLKSNPDKRYSNIADLQNALKRSNTGLIITATVIVAASVAAILIARYNDRSDCSAADIDGIFEQATQMIEEASEADL